MSVLTYVLSALTALYPVSMILSSRMGYSIKAVDVPFIAVSTVLLSVCLVALDLVGKKTIEGKFLKIIYAIITPISLINAVLCLFESSENWLIFCFWVSVCCSLYLTIKYGRPLAIKIVSLALILPIVYLSFFAFVFGSIGQNTVTNTVESPNGKYYAQVVDSDQGALGGDTLVCVYSSREINLGLLIIKKQPHTIYSGDWGEYKNMKIEWKDDNCLLINNEEYKVDY